MKHIIALRNDIYLDRLAVIGIVPAKVEKINFETGKREIKNLWPIKFLEMSFVKRTSFLIHDLM